MKSTPKKMYRAMPIITASLIALTTAQGTLAALLAVSVLALFGHTDTRYGLASGSHLLFQILRS